MRIPKVGSRWTDQLARTFVVGPGGDEAVTTLLDYKGEPHDIGTDFFHNGAYQCVSAHPDEMWEAPEVAEPEEIEEAKHAWRTFAAAHRVPSVPSMRPECFRIGQRWLCLDGEKRDLEGEVVGIRNDDASGISTAVLRMSDRSLSSIECETEVFLDISKHITIGHWKFVGGPTEQADESELVREASLTALLLCPEGVRMQDWKVVVAGLEARLRQQKPGDRVSDWLLEHAEIAGHVLSDAARASKERDR